MIMLFTTKTFYGVTYSCFVSKTGLSDYVAVYTNVGNL